MRNIVAHGLDFKKAVSSKGGALGGPPRFVAKYHAFLSMCSVFKSSFRSSAAHVPLLQRLGARGRSVCPGSFKLSRGRSKLSRFGPRFGPQFGTVCAIICPNLPNSARVFPTTSEGGQHLPDLGQLWSELHYLRPEAVHLSQTWRRTWPNLFIPTIIKPYDCA